MGSKEKPWKRKAITALYVVAIVNILVSAERLVFDALGQMWVILFTNAITITATMFCILGVMCRRNTAIIAFIVFTVLALAVNIVIVLIFNDVGIFADKDNYLSLTLNDQHWWKDHGFLCYTVCNHGNDPTNDASDNGGGNDQGGGGEGPEGSGGGLLMPLPQEPAAVPTNGSGLVQECFASYVVIETAHASVNMLLMIITIFLSLCALNLRKRRRGSHKLVPTSDRSRDNDSFRYLGIGKYGGNAPRHGGGNQRNSGQPSFYKLSDSFDSTTSSRN